MQPTTMLPKLTETTQLVTFSEDEGVCTAEVFATDVVINTNPGNHNHGSSNVKLKNLVDYNWEPKFYPGQLLATHMTGKYLAYSIKAPNAASPGMWTGMVRVVYNPEPGTDRRALIKGMKGEVQDLAFAHIQNQVVLASIDEHGSFYVHEIEATDSGLRCTLVAEEHVESEAAVSGAGGAAHRVVWCPYIPDDDDQPDDDVARLLLTTHDNTARMWNIRTGAGGEGEGEGGGVGALGGAAWGAEHGAPLVDAAFSPDGTALATAAADGYVMFYQSLCDYFSDEKILRFGCNRPLTNEPDTNTRKTEIIRYKPGIFLIEFVSQLQETIFKNPSLILATEGVHAQREQPALPTQVAAARGRAPLVFVLSGQPQTIQHRRSILEVRRDRRGEQHDHQDMVVQVVELPADDQVLGGAGRGWWGAGAGAGALALKAVVDASARWVVVSCGQARALYVLHVPRDHADRAAACRAVAELLLPYPVLSFCILDAEEEQVKCESSCDDPFHTNGSTADMPDSPDDFDLQQDEDAVGSGGEGAEESDKRVRIRLYIVQPKGLQEAELTYCPPPLHRVEAEASVETGVASSILQQQSQQLKNLLMRSQTQPGSLIVPRAESPVIAPPLNLMTPDAFSSPGKRDEDDPPLSATPDVPGAPRVSNQGVNEASGTVTSGGGGGGGGGAELHKLTSGGSSPSREVQEIMGHNDRAYYKDHMEENQEVEEEVDSADVVTSDAVAEADASDDYPRPEVYNATETAPTNISNETLWPQISLAQISEANQRKASSEKSSSQSLNTSLLHNDRLSPADRSRLLALDHKLDKLTELVSAQSRELRSLRAAVGSPRQAVDAALHAHTQRTAAAVHDALADGFERISRIGEAASSRAAQAAGLGAARGLEPLAAALQHELATKLTATDHLLRDNIEKLANSKASAERDLTSPTINSLYTIMLMEKLSTSIAKSLSEMVREQFREALMESVVPVVEKAHAHMFRQINAAFQAGTKEFAANTEAAARAAAERGAAASTAALRAAIERHAATLHALPAPPAPQHYTAAIQDAAHTYVYAPPPTTAALHYTTPHRRHRAARGHPARPPRPARPATLHRRHTGRRAHSGTRPPCTPSPPRPPRNTTPPPYRTPRTRTYTHRRPPLLHYTTLHHTAAIERHAATLHALPAPPAPQHYTAAIQDAAHTYVYAPPPTTAALHYTTPHRRHRAARGHPARPPRPARPATLHRRHTGRRAHSGTRPPCTPSPPRPPRNTTPPPYRTPRTRTYTHRRPPLLHYTTLHHTAAIERHAATLHALPAPPAPQHYTAAIQDAAHTYVYAPPPTTAALHYTTPHRRHRAARGHPARPPRPARPATLHRRHTGRRAHRHAATLHALPAPPAPQHYTAAIQDAAHTYVYAPPPTTAALHYTTPHRRHRAARGHPARPPRPARPATLHRRHTGRRAHSGTRPPCTPSPPRPPRNTTPPPYRTPRTRTYTHRRPPLLHYTTLHHTAAIERHAATLHALPAPPAPQHYTAAIQDAAHTYVYAPPPTTAALHYTTLHHTAAIERHAATLHALPAPPAPQHYTAAIQDTAHTYVYAPPPTTAALHYTTPHRRHRAARGHPARPPRPARPATLHRRHTGRRAHRHAATLHALPAPPAPKHYTAAIQDAAHTYVYAPPPTTAALHYTTLHHITPHHTTPHHTTPHRRHRQDAMHICINNNTLRLVWTGRESPLPLSNDVKFFPDFRVISKIYPKKENGKNCIGCAIELATPVRSRIFKIQDGGQTSGRFIRKIGYRHRIEPILTHLATFVRVLPGKHFLGKYPMEKLERSTGNTESKQRLKFNLDFDRLGNPAGKFLRFTPKTLTVKEIILELENWYRSMEGAPRNDI
ncbi:unnamed protein product [Diatraea saccharalis]|uniref:Enhancer of mRNA-decapping protein 4 WD40 repeat region domain-containing protein n=1 Tax=Diatraea saccharalis TaxID=40085 RepID=A0A9N9W727_9NEOP|nr:unnamed protein product [Diatraea saccharalis]